MKKTALFILVSFAAGAHAEDTLLKFDKLVFVKRYTYHSSHFYTDFIDGVGNYGGNLCILDVKTGKVTDLLPQMKDGIFGRFDLSFDANAVYYGSYWGRLHIDHLGHPNFRPVPTLEQATSTVPPLPDGQR